MQQKTPDTRLVTAAGALPFATVVLVLALFQNTVNASQGAASILLAWYIFIEHIAFTPLRNLRVRIKAQAVGQDDMEGTVTEDVNVHLVRTQFIVSSAALIVIVERAVATQAFMGLPKTVVTLLLSVLLGTYIFSCMHVTQQAIRKTIETAVEHAKQEAFLRFIARAGLFPTDEEEGKKEEEPSKADTEFTEE